MMHYDRTRNTNIVQSCFLGANSAMKLRLSDKIYFPVCHMNHWFLFIVDLKNSCYVFLDSYYDQTDPFQREVSSTLVKVFKTAWSLYACSSIDLSSFRISYPPVPKQTTFDKNTEDKTLVNNLFKQGIDAHIIN
ncbi:hypothetical protein U9M48_018604 [Paspalum notatum var. saurae]|uniref:Ubiquitin-like protease family profile domain-containing protein n=1 Tax=Paspalum notatum var. saurae TaxID=547442 RepID=A0AAQ3TB07_PASNO